MAQTRLLTQRQVANYLDTLLAVIRDLPIVAEHWPEMSSIEQNTFASDWDELMDELDLLTEYDRDGLLGKQEQEILQVITAAYKDVEQVVLNLDLDRPALVPHIH